MRAKSSYLQIVLVICLQSLTAAIAQSATTSKSSGDWPTYRADVRRSGISAGALAFPLAESWVHKADHRPSPAWPELTAPNDFWHRLHGLSHTHTFDRSFCPIRVGSRVYYGSSSDDAVRCLDAQSGKLLWTFYTEGPIRLAPSVADGRLYVGSDDGMLYCLDPESGSLNWKFKAQEQQDRLPGNGRMISRWPVRCGIVVDNGVVYYTSGLFPGQGVELCAVDAANGKKLWSKPISISAQGYLLASSSRLFVPTGRTSPQAFDRASGKPLGDYGRVGGCFALVDKDVLVHGTSENGQLHLSEPNTREGIVSTAGQRLIAKGPMLYILGKKSLSALNRTQYIEINKQITRLKAIKKPSEEEKEQLAALLPKRRKCQKWKVDCRAPFELIMAGNTLIAGGKDQVLAFDAATGKNIWSAPVDGKAYSLAAAGGQLLVSTDSGKIHCFAKIIKKPLSPTQAFSAALGDINQHSFVGTPHVKYFQLIAKTILKQTGIQQGYCIVLDAGGGDLARELALHSKLRIVGVESDPAKLAQARKMLAAEGLYGTRVVMHQGRPGKLPYQQCSANLIVSAAALLGGELPNMSDIAHAIRPCGGKVVLASATKESDPAVLKKHIASAAGLQDCKTTNHNGILLAVATRGKIPGSTEWTHGYAEPGNTACSGDGTIGGAVEMQWFGRPGPRRMVDRHHQNISSLYKDGRLFVPGDCVVYTLDAYNGTVLWQVDVPDSRRLAMSHDSSSMAVDDRRVYLAAGDKCLAFNVASGKQEAAFAAPQKRLLACR